MKSLFALLFLSSACGSASHLGGGGGDPLAFSRQTRGLLGIETSFVAYVPHARRISMIDPASERETSFQAAPIGVAAALPVARVDGIALVAPDSLTIRSGGAERTFATGLTHGWDAAADAAAFVLPSEAGVRIVRYLADGSWQNEFAPVAFTSGAQSLALIARDGATAAAFSPTDDSIAVFEATGGSAPLVAARVCRLPASGAPLTAAALDGKQLYLGDSAGAVRTLDLATCVGRDLAAMPTAGAEISRVAVLGGGRVGVAQRGGDIAILRAADGSLEASARTDCGFPLAPTEVPAAGVVFLCLVGVGDESAASIPYKALELWVVNLTTGATSLRRLLPQKAVAGFGLSPETGKFLALSDGALGTLTVIDVATGATRTRQGLFTQGLLTRD